jgi:hypothetical protein
MRKYDFKYALIIIFNNDKYIKSEDFQILMSEKPDIQEHVKRTNYQLKILEAIIVSSISDDNSKLPTVKEYIFSELVNGTLEYIAADAGTVTYQDYKWHDDVLLKILKNYNSEMSKHTENKLDSKLKDALNKMFACKFINDTPKVCELFKYICPVDMHSIYSPSYESVMKVRKDILPELSDKERENVIGIGKAMRKFVDKDVESIKKDYCW